AARRRAAVGPHAPPQRRPAPRPLVPGGPATAPDLAAAVEAAERPERLHLPRRDARPRPPARSARLRPSHTPPQRAGPPPTGGARAHRPAPAVPDARPGRLLDPGRVAPCHPSPRRRVRRARDGPTAPGPVDRRSRPSGPR